MLDDLNKLPIIDCQPDIPYRDMTYKLLWYSNNRGVVVDEDGLEKDIVPMPNSLESLHLFNNYKVVHWSKVEGMLRSEPRFYAVGEYDQQEMNNFVICYEESVDKYNKWLHLDVGDVVWFREGVFHYSDKLLGLLPVVTGEGMEDEVLTRVMGY